MGRQLAAALPQGPLLKGPRGASGRADYTIIISPRFSRVRSPTRRSSAVGHADDRRFAIRERRAVSSLERARTVGMLVCITSSTGWPALLQRLDHGVAREHAAKAAAAVDDGELGLGGADQGIRGVRARAGARIKR